MVPTALSSSPTFRSPCLRIGTRGSPLALAQAREVCARLAAADPALAEPGALAVVVIKTTGDRIQDRPLAEAGGKGLFTKEIEDALLAGTIDAAVHSMKDVPTWLPPGLIIPCLLPREDPRDAWFSRTGCTLDDLPPGAVVGTASLRRQAQVLARRPDLRLVSLRGNVGTRLRKLDEGEVDATLLAAAGLNRLGRPRTPTCLLDPEAMLPAVAQGAIGIEIRVDDHRTAAWLAPLHCPATGIAVTAERSLLATLDGSCRTPIAALAEPAADGLLRLRTLVLSPDGRRRVADQRSGPAAQADALGRSAGTAVKARMPVDFFTASAPVP